MTEVSPGAAEPITLDAAKAFLRVTHSDEDALIGSLITAALEYVETQVRRSLGPEIPFALRHAVLLLVAHWYERRVPVSERAALVPEGLGALIAPYRELSL